jgi:high-affinity iron transporter
MLAAFLIVFREVIEAGLVVGITMAVTRGLPRAGTFIASGVAAGVAGAGLVALFIDVISAQFAGTGQELFNALVLSVAVVMLIWHTVWMAQHGAELVADIRASGKAIREGAATLTGLSIVVGVAVLREGAEVALFLFGLAMSGGGASAEILSGGVAGLFAGAALAAITYFGLVQIPMKHLFRVTGVLLSLLAAGMAAQAAQFLAQADLVNVLQQEAWNSEWLLSEQGIMGKAMHALIGYVDRPSILQVVAYTGVLTAIALLTSMTRIVPATRQKA